MARQPILIVLAVAVTVLDAVVFVHNGLLVWRVAEATLWPKMALTLLASVGMYSLIDIWVNAFAGVPSTPTKSISRNSEEHSEQLSEGANV
jgi:hypothetical protein